jgi:hypothetical protein
MEKQDHQGQDDTPETTEDALSDEELDEITGGTQRPVQPRQVPGLGIGGVPMPFPPTPFSPLPPLDDPAPDRE